MLIPIRHENMSARRLPVVTIGLIVLNTLIFLGTHWTMDAQSEELAVTKTHLLVLAALHPELTIAPQAQKFVDSFRKAYPKAWDSAQDPQRAPFDGWETQMRSAKDPDKLQAEMDLLDDQYAIQANASIVENYAFTPGNTKLITYITSIFLHGGWLHLIGNMWFLWLSGFVLEDLWGRPLFTAFYLVSGVAATQFHAWTNAGSIIPTLGASGAIAALMGAFLVRFPKMKIEMFAWLFVFRFKFKAAAYWLLPIWLTLEILYGGLEGGAGGGVAHWAHVGGFIFGVLIALAIQHSGLEHQMNAAIEEKIAAVVSPELEQASALMDENKLDEATVILNNHLAANADSVDGLNLLRAIYLRRSETQLYQEATLKVCGLHLKIKDDEAAWHDYEDFTKAGGGNLPAAMWLDLCRVLESNDNFEFALGEYTKLIAAYPKDRQSLMAQMAAARLCLKRLGRPQDALNCYEAAAASEVPHLDLEATIAMGIKEAKNVITAQAKAATV